MCGIAGVLMPRRQPFSAPEALSVVSAMTRRLAHRGPDAHGVWLDREGRCALGHSRLAVIDISDAGTQPFSSADGRLHVTYNGEIYNYRELAASLTQSGVRLATQTDTEVLVEALATHGPGALQLFDGMFAFAAFDERTGTAILARDRFGEKPLYYMPLGSRAIAFASELQALECVPGFDSTVSLDAIAEMLSLQYIGAPRSIYANVQKLDAGEVMTVGPDGEISTRRYFRFEPKSECISNDTRIDTLVDELEDLLIRSIRRRMISDVPIGALLSGGIDSSVTCALIRRRLHMPLSTFTLGFTSAPKSEHDKAAAVAKHLATAHHAIMMDAADTTRIEGLGSILDEPSGDSSCLPTYMLAKFAREAVTVALSGEGGDELFGGYARYQTVLNEAKCRSGCVRGGDIRYGKEVLLATESDVSELLGCVPDGFAARLEGLRHAIDAATPSLLAAMRKDDTENYLPGAVLAKMDRMSMQHALEVRTPFLNEDVARFAERLPDDLLVQDQKGKLLLRKLAYRYLPKQLVDMPKLGFGLPPGTWTRSSLMGAATVMLESPESRLAEAFGQKRVARFVQKHLNPQLFRPYQVCSVVLLESWLRSHPAKIPADHER